MILLNNAWIYIFIVLIFLEIFCICFNLKSYAEQDFIENYITRQSKGEKEC